MKWVSGSPSLKENRQGPESNHSFLALSFFIGIVRGGVQLGPLGTAATNRPIVPAPGNYDDGEIGGMIGRGNRNTRRKLAPVPLCPPQTPNVARTQTRSSALESQLLVLRLRICGTI
jgi:hypothetical protein